MRNSFADDHPIEMLREGKRPTRKNALRALARRAAWLSKKIETFGMRAKDPKASYLVEELASIAIAVEAIEASRQADGLSASEHARFVVTIQDKSLYGEPDVAIGVVDAPDAETACRAAHWTIDQLADAGRGRCVPHARTIEPGKFYRLGAVVRLPRDPNAENQ